MDRETKNGTERLAAFSDGVIAIILTIMVLELRPPHGLGLGALWTLWPTFVSYVLSYLFVGIGWVNHHHLLRQADEATGKLLWSNLLFLFSLSLIPFATAYLADERLASFAVAFYAFIFLFVTVAFICFEAAVVRQSCAHHKRKPGVRIFLSRNMLALIAYGIAIPAAYLSPLLALLIIGGMSLLYFAPGQMRSIQCKQQESK